MMTPEAEILNEHRLRKELRGKLENLVKEYLGDLNPYAIIGELESTKLKLSDCAGRAVWRDIEKNKGNQ